MVYRFAEYNKSSVLRNHLNLGGSNPSGERIDITSLYLERGGKPWFTVMGEYHFARADKDTWYTELCKMKAGGVQTVATYLFWIYHEEEEGKIDFSGDLDVRKFVLDAGKAGLDVVLRVGPWAHGECRNGGLPDWILKKGYKVRDNNPGYLEKVKFWYKAISDEVQGLFYKDGGNIVAIQLDNELVNNAPHLATLKEIAIETGLIAPLYTVTGWNSKYGAKIPVDEVFPVFGGYPDAPWAGGTHELPLSQHYAFYTMRNDTAIGADLIESEKDTWQLPYERYPFATCELGPGMQSTHHRRVVVSPIDAYAMSLVKVGCGNNLAGYYMYHGGTDKIGKLSTFNETKATGYPNDYPIRNYDFGTCLSEYGEARLSYNYLNLLHMFINDFGSILAPMEHVAAFEFVKETDFDNLRYCLRTDGEGGFVFVNNHQRHAKLPAHKDVVIDTGKVVFPSIDVEADSAFILPYNIDLGPVKLKYATAQLLCASENTYFFMKLKGIDATYAFEDGTTETVTAGLYPGFTHDGIRIVTVEEEDALYLRKLSGRVYVGHKANLYEYYDYIDEKNVIGAIEDGDYSYEEWSGENFYENHREVDFLPADWDLEDCSEAFEIPEMFAWELNIESNPPRKVTWKKLSVNSQGGFIEINERYDVAQIFADRELVADRYYDGTIWRIPSKLLYGHECFLVMSELKDDIYIEK